MDWTTIITSVVSILVTVGLMRLIQLIKATRGENRADKGQNAELLKSEVAQALDMYKALVLEYKADEARMDEYHRLIEEERLKYREENAVLRTENKLLKVELEIARK